MGREGRGGEGTCGKENYKEGGKGEVREKSGGGDEKGGVK